MFRLVFSEPGLEISELVYAVLVLANHVELEQKISSVAFRQHLDSIPLVGLGRALQKDTGFVVLDFEEAEALYIPVYFVDFAREAMLSVKQKFEFQG